MGAIATIRICFCTLAMGFALPLAAQIITDDAPQNIGSAPTTSYSDDKQLFLLLNVGFAAPAGIFASTDILSDDAAYAKSGFNLNVNVGRTFNRFVGITATGGYIMQTNRTDELVDNFNRYGPPSVRILEYDYPGMRFIYAAGGLLVSIPATDRFAIDVKLQAGIGLGIDHELTLKMEDAMGVFIVQYGKASDVAFLPDLGLNLRLLVTDKFTMNFFTDFVMANFKYTDVPVYENGNAVDSYDYNLLLRNVNVGIGAGWSF